MKKIKLYLKTFYLPILLLIIAIILWFNVPKDYHSFKTALIASVLGVGIAIFTAESYKRLNEHKKIKRTFGFLSLITIPYLKNQYENILETMNIYQDICSIHKAQAFLILVSNFNSISLDFDKSWLQLIYSQGFVDSIKSDEQFSKISNAIFEILLFTKLLTAQSINAKHLISNDLSNLSQQEMEILLQKTQRIRNDLNDNTQKLKKYTNKLEEEIESFFSKNAVQREEFER